MGRKKIQRFRRRSDLIPTGSTLLNLALSENPFGGFSVGTVVNIVGDTHAGKTMLFWQMMAELSYNSMFDDYQLYYNDAESALKFNIKQLFGEKTDHRVHYGDKEKTAVLEEAITRIKTLLKKSVPIVHGTDSLDNLRSRKEIAKSGDKIGEQDYPSEPRILSKQLGVLTDMVSKTKSLLVIISQTRKNIGVMFGESLRRSGGDALHFYSSHELWLAVKTHITRKNREVGIVARVRVKKNKLTGKQRIVEFPIYSDYGIDDIGSMIDWMIAEKFWSGKSESAEKKKSKLNEDLIVKTNGDFIDGSRKKLIAHIEENNLEDALRIKVAERWMEIEKDIESRRKKRYSE